jgi:AraC-like DNA-binding protein
VSQSREVSVRFFPPPEALRQFFTTFYLLEVTVPDGGTVSDYLPPEWGNLRFHSGARPVAVSQDGVKFPVCDNPHTGPSSQTMRFSIGTTRMWGIGLLPLGWATFVRASAADHANRVVDGGSHPAFASFAPLARSLFGERPDVDAELARISGHFLGRSDEPPALEERIVAIHSALIDQGVASVGDLIESVGASLRTVERLCKSAFGFPPKLLLRRQRFMRSLADFMLDPSLKWIGAIDGQYHDQAQFVRDFHQFVGMTPRQFAALDKPVLSEVMRERMRLGRAPVQTLDSPNGAGFQP